MVGRNLAWALSAVAALSALGGGMGVWVLGLTAAERTLVAAARGTACVAFDPRRPEMLTTWEPTRPPLGDGYCKIKRVP